MKFHPLCKALPEMSEEEFQALADDIKKHGLREPILVFDGQIIDGRHRYLACKAAGVDPEFKAFNGANPLALVKSLNVFRRHLTEPQRAMIAATLANATVGKRASLPDIKEDHRASLPDIKEEIVEDNQVTNAEAAKVMKVSERSVKQAKLVQRKAAKPIQDAVNEGKLTINAAVKLAMLPKKEQSKIAKKGVDEMKQTANEISKPRGGLGNEAIAAKDQKAAENEKEKMLEALEIWWDDTKKTMAYSAPSPKMCYDGFKKLIQETL